MQVAIVNDELIFFTESVPDTRNDDIPGVQILGIGKDFNAKKKRTARAGQFLVDYYNSVLSAITTDNSMADAQQYLYGGAKFNHLKHTAKSKDAFKPISSYGISFTLQESLALWPTVHSTIQILSNILDDSYEQMFAIPKSSAKILKIFTDNTGVPISLQSTVACVDNSLVLLYRINTLQELLVLDFCTFYGKADNYKYIGICKACNKAFLKICWDAKTCSPECSKIFSAQQAKGNGCFQPLRSAESAYSKRLKRLKEMMSNWSEPERQAALSSIQAKYEKWHSFAVEQKQSMQDSGEAFAMEKEFSALIHQKWVEYGLPAEFEKYQKRKE